MLIENRHKLNFARLDDVAIGRVFEDLITPVSLPHLNINSSKEVEQLLQRDMKEVLSFRCKTDTLPRSDWQIAQQVIRKLRNQR